VADDRSDPAPDRETVADLDAGHGPDAPGILDRLPPAIGSDLVSASAELHYLEVVTTRGRATLLGRLSQLEIEMGAVGLRVHRSHWVSLAHVRRVYRSRHGWHCELRDGRRLPIARRRVSDVQDRLGRDFVVNATAE
jgi:DNA-binding LytR/AlgR family response regulator